MALWYRYFSRETSPDPLRFSPRTGALPLALSLALLLASGGAGAQLAPAAPTEGGGGAAALAPIVVAAERAGAAAGSSLTGFSAAPLASTPLAIDVISADDLLERGVQSLSSAIRTDPSVGDNYNTFGYIEALQIRGFTLNELLNYQRDGMTVSSHVPVALENKESIEILKGTSGMLAGSSAPGGLVNYVLKQPTAQALDRIDATVSERGSALVHGDFGGHLGPQGTFGYRINLAAEERRPEVDGAWSKRTLASGFFDWHAAPGTLLQLEFEHQKVREISVPGYALVDSTNSGTATALPAPISPDINLNTQPWSQPFESTQTSGSLRLAQRLAPDWDLSLRAGTQRSATNDRIAFPDGCSYVNANRNSTTVAPGSPNYYYLLNGLCSNFNVDIYQYVSPDEVRNTNDTDTHVHGVLRAGGAEHEITVGFKTTRYTERYPPEQIYNYVGTVNVFAPAALPANATPNTLNAPADTDLDELYAFDAAHFGDRWSTWLGARFTRITEDSALTDGTQATRLQQHLATPWAGVGYVPWSGGFTYASAGGGVEVANVPNHPGIANAGQALPALRSRQVELGFKQRAGAAWSFDGALFRITKPFADTLPLADGQTLQIGGARKERHQGVELAGTWQALATLSLRASATAIDAKTTAALDPAWIGKAATNVAPLAVALEDVWSPAALPGFAWSNIGTYAGHKSVLPDGSVDLPRYWQWDTSARYRRVVDGRQWTWRAGIDNVTNHAYWREAPTASWGSVYLFPAQARAARLGLSVSW
jgi:iron complex outermembrane receptor protein